MLKKKRVPVGASAAGRVCPPLVVLAEDFSRLVRFRRVTQDNAKVSLLH